MKNLIISCILIICFKEINAQWKPTKNDITIVALQLVSGAADGLREEVLYHPNNLFKVNSNLNRQYWDSRISWHNKENHWVVFSDANHTLRTTVQTFDLLSIGFTLREKQHTWKAAIRKMILSYLARKVGFSIIYNIHFKNKL